MTRGLVVFESMFGNTPGDRQLGRRWSGAASAGRPDGGRRHTDGARRRRGPAGGWRTHPRVRDESPRDPAIGRSAVPTRAGVGKDRAARVAGQVAGEFATCRGGHLRHPHRQAPPPGISSGRCGETAATAWLPVGRPVDQLYVKEQPGRWWTGNQNVPAAGGTSWGRRSPPSSGSAAPCQQTTTGPSSAPGSGPEYSVSPAPSGTHRAAGGRAGGCAGPARAARRRG
jgi:hypothetical protein